MLKENTQKPGSKLVHILTRNTYVNSVIVPSTFLKAFIRKNTCIHKTGLLIPVQQIAYDSSIS